MDKSSLHLAISSARDEMTREIFRGIADLDVDEFDDPQSPTPLDLFLDRRQLELIHSIGELLAQGADIDELGPQGLSPLQSCAQAGLWDACRLLIERGARLDPPGPAAPDRVWVAEKFLDAKQFNLLRLMAQRGALFDGLDMQGATLLALAASTGQADICAFLIEQGLDPHAADRDGATPACRASALDRVSVLETLRELGVDLGRAGPTGLTPLMGAARHGSSQSLRLLLSTGIEPNAQDHGGVSALMAAAAHDHAACVELLLAHGADPHLLDAQGQDASCHAAAGSALDSLRALRAGGARFNLPKLLEIARAELDKPHHMGAPCLAFIETQLIEAELLGSTPASAASEPRRL